MGEHLEKAVPILDVFDNVHDTKVDEDDLKLIAENSNRRVRDTGDLCPVVIGHTRPDASETEQPPVCGYAKNFRVEEIGRENPRPCLVADFMFPTDEAWETAKKYPRRSVELHKADMIIDPIALLGATSPARDLGLLFAKSNKQSVHNLSKYSGANMEVDEIVSKVLEAFAQSDWGKWIQEKMKAEAEPVADAEEAVNMAAEGEEEDPKDDDSEELSKYKLKCQRDQARRQVARFQKEHDDMRGVVEALTLKFQRSEREKELLKVEAEGVAFDMAEELDAVEHMDDKGFTAHVGRMKKRYQKAPLGPLVKLAKVPEHGNSGPKEFSREDMERALELARTKKMNIKEAINTVKGVN